MPRKSTKTESIKETKEPSEAVELASAESNRETTRSQIANIYVWAFVIIVGVSTGIGLFFKNVSETKEIIVTLSGILSGPLGFIIGYYFKAGKE